MPGFSPPLSLLNISVYRLQPRLFIDSLPYLKKTQKDHKVLLYNEKNDVHCFSLPEFVDPL
jgi:hypothetical protein